MTGTLVVVVGGFIVVVLAVVVLAVVVLAAVVLAVVVLALVVLAIVVLAVVVIAVVGCVVGGSADDSQQINASVGSVLVSLPQAPKWAINVCSSSGYFALS